MALRIGYLSLKTRIGDVWIGTTPRGVFWVEFGDVDTDSLRSFFEGGDAVTFERGGEVSEKAGREIVRYLEGELTRFTVPLDLAGSTLFAKKVWRVTRKIPYGRVRTYAWVAERTGDPNSARAVGQALGANPVPIIIPCHRVVASDGSLGGFGGGLSIKRRLLAIESGQSTLGLDPGRLF